jgi:translation elongation factor EF-G
MDRVGADFDAAIDSMHKKLAANAWPVLIPSAKRLPQGPARRCEPQGGVLSRRQLDGLTYEVREVPEDSKELVEKAYATLVEQISNIDDEIAEAVLEEKEVTPQMLKAGIRRQTIANKFVPVVGGSRSRTRASSTSLTRHRLPPGPARHSASGRPRSRQYRDEDPSADGRQWPVLLACIQALERSFRR